MLQYWQQCLVNSIVLATPKQQSVQLSRVEYQFQQDNAPLHNASLTREWCGGYYRENYTKMADSLLILPT